MEYLILIFGIVFIFFLAYVLFGSHMDPTSVSELDEIAEYQMRKDG